MLFILLIILLVPLFIVLLCLFFLFLRRKIARILLGAALLVVSCLICLLAFIFVRDFSSNYYTYKITVDSEHLESFFIDFDTPQQYEEWLCPDERYGGTDTFSMDKTIVLDNPYNEVRFSLTYFEKVQSSISYYNSIMKFYASDKIFKPPIKIGEDYEYSFSNAHCRKEYNGLWSERVEDYYASVMIRYKNCYIRFTEETKEPRESRLGEAIDQLWADYEQYKSNMEGLAP